MIAYNMGGVVLLAESVHEELDVTCWKRMLLCSYLCNSIPSLLVVAGPVLLKTISGTGGMQFFLPL